MRDPQSKNSIYHYLTPVFLGKAGMRLKKERALRGLTQLELAQALGCSQGLVAKIENGQAQTASFTYASFYKIFRSKARAILMDEEKVTRQWDE
jgi:transcriptional regulator with XRE-family HTH domain